MHATSRRKERDMVKYLFDSAIGRKDNGEFCIETQIFFLAILTI